MLGKNFLYILCVCLFFTSTIFSLTFELNQLSHDLAMLADMLLSVEEPRTFFATSYDNNDSIVLYKAQWQESETLKNLIQDSDNENKLIVGEQMFSMLKLLKPYFSFLGKSKEQQLLQATFSNLDLQTFKDILYATDFLAIQPFKQALISKPLEKQVPAFTNEMLTTHSEQNFKRALSSYSITGYLNEEMAQKILIPKKTIIKTGWHRVSSFNFNEWSSTSKYFAITGSKGQIIIIDRKKQEIVLQEKAHHFCWSPNGKCIAIKFDNIIKIIDMETNKTNAISAPPGDIGTLALSNNGHYIACYYSKGLILRIFNVADNKETFSTMPLLAMDSAIRAQWSNNGKKLAFNDDYHTTIINFESRTSFWKHFNKESNERFISAPCWSPNDEQVLVNCKKKQGDIITETPTLYDPNTENKIGRLEAIEYEDTIGIRGEITQFYWLPMLNKIIGYVTTDYSKTFATPPTIPGDKSHHINYFCHVDYNKRISWNSFSPYTLLTKEPKRLAEKFKSPDGYSSIQCGAQANLVLKNYYYKPKDAPLSFEQALVIRYIVENKLDVDALQSVVKEIYDSLPELIKNIIA